MEGIVLEKVLILLLAIVILTLTGCANEKNVIALQKSTYTPNKAIIHVYYFPTQNVAELTFEQKDVEDYYLFRMSEKNPEEFFKELSNKPNVEIVAENDRRITFNKDNDITAIEKVTEFIDKNNMYLII